MGIGGYYMGLNMSGSFNSSCWINGYGWIAVALVIFANWNPALAILGTFVFGFFNTLRVSGSSLAAAFPGPLGWLAGVPTQLYQALPFLITAVVLVVTSVRKREGSGLPASLGLNYFDTMRFIVVPQAFKNILPSLGNEFITLFKDTSLVNTIGAAELTYQAMRIGGRTFDYMPPLIGSAVMYLIIVIIFTWVQGKLERRLRQSDRR